jgi:hypothetical protein
MVIYGADGKPVAMPTRPPEGAPPALPRWARYSSHPGAGITPQRLGALLRAGGDGDWASWAELADDIEERDGHIGSVLSTRRLALQGRVLDVTRPATTSATSTSRSGSATSCASARSCSGWCPRSWVRWASASGCHG